MRVSNALFSIRNRKSMIAAAACAGLSLLLSGCGLGTAAPAGDGLGPITGSLSGIAHGGRQPISGANVYAFLAGTSGYGSAPTLLASTTTSTDGNGAFSFSAANTPADGITCTGTIGSGNNILYIVISGGQPTSGTTNNSSALMAVLGDCSTAVTGQVVTQINEVTTFASITAMQQFFSVGSGTIAAGTLDAIGAPSTNLQGMAIAANTVPNMVNLTTGTAAATTKTGTGTNINGTATVTITPEIAKINSAANSLAACVNSDGGSSSPCHTLYPDVNSTAATDTMNAAYYMASNPTDTVSGTSNISTVYGLAVPNAPFGGGLGAVPTDWTIGVTYAAASTTTGSCNFNGTAGYPLILYGYDISVDSNGNVWNDGGGTPTPGGAMGEITGTGKPVACSGVVGPSRGGAVIDTAGNIWAASGTTGASGVFSYVVKFDGTTTTQIPIPGATAKAYAMAADGNGNVFVTDASAALKLYEFPSTAIATTVPTTVGSVTGASPFTIAVDTQGTVVVGQSGSSGSTITAFPLTTVGGTTYGAAQNLAQTGAYAGVYGIAFDSSGAFWVGNSAGTSGTGVAGVGTPPGNTTSATTVSYNTGTTPVTVNFGTPANVTTTFAGGMSTSRKVAIDGNNNIWIANNTAASSGLYGITELTNNGTSTIPTAVSPTSTSGTTTITNNGGFQKATTVLSAPRGIAIDGSGNVWVSDSNSGTGTTFMTEIVGAAGPVVTPLSMALKNSKLGQKP